MALRWHEKKIKSDSPENKITDSTISTWLLRVLYYFSSSSKEPSEAGHLHLLSTQEKKQKYRKVTEFTGSPRAVQWEQGFHMGCLMAEFTGLIMRLCCFLPCWEKAWGGGEGGFSVRERSGLLFFLCHITRSGSALSCQLISQPPELCFLFEG